MDKNKHLSDAPEIALIKTDPEQRFDSTRLAPGSGDFGCPACPAPPSGDLIVDARDRWWHAGCVGRVLGQHTRWDERRGERYHYEWPTPRK